MGREEVAKIKLNYFDDDSFLIKILWPSKAF